MKAVVLDLFGTLVAAPTPGERSHASARLASVIGCDATSVECYLRDSWSVRHDGALPTLPDLAAHLVRAVNGAGDLTERVADELQALAQVRVMPDSSVVRALDSLRGRGLRLGILSDASADVVAAWPNSPLAKLVDASIFSCVVGAVKPDQRLYDRIRRGLDSPADQMLYVGDGGGDELHGATAAGMGVVAVRRRGSCDVMAFGATEWSGATLDAVECLPNHLVDLT